MSADRGQAGDGGSEADSGAGAPPPRGRGRPARPDPVASGTDDSEVRRRTGGGEQQAPQHAHGYLP
jgi:hypothetical protein